MTGKSIESDTTVLRLTLASSVAVLLAGVAVLVSANTQIPVVTGPQQLLSLSGNAVGFESLTNTSPSNTNRLSREQLKHNALAIMRGLPAQYPSEQEFQAASERVVQQIEAEQPTVNVNTFLLSGRISNASQLAELQMQPFFSEFNSAVFLNADTLVERDSYSGVGFPHIETNDRADSERYKPYKQLVSFSSNEQGDIVPHIKCMGLSPERVAKRAKQYDAKIFELAVKHNVSASLVKAVVAKESCYNPAARSRVGAIGLMQLMPETAKWLKVKQPENPSQNLAAGVRYLAQLRKRFGSNELALAAYNAGPGNVERYKGIPPFAETQNYVQDVMYFYRGYVATTRFVNALNDFD